MKNCPSCPVTLFCFAGYRLETYRCERCNRLILTHAWRDDVSEDESCVVATFTTGLTMWPVPQGEYHMNPELVEAAAQCSETPFSNQHDSEHSRVFVDLCDECEKKGEGQ